VNRGLLALIVATLALPLAGSAATRAAGTAGGSVELVALLDGKPLAERPLAAAEIGREQARVAAPCGGSAPTSPAGKVLAR